MAIRVLAVGNTNITQADHRNLITALTVHSNSVNHRPGLFPTNLPAAISNLSAMVAQISAFKAIVSNPSGSGAYLVQSDSTSDVEFEPGEAGVTRTDRIIIRVYNNAQDGSGRDEAVVEYLKGQSSGSATALPNGSLLLYEVPVPAGASSGGGGINFTGIAVDKRVYTVASGGVIPVATTTELNAISGPYDGMIGYVRNTGHLYVYNGTLWRPKGGALSVLTSASLSGILNPEDGTIAVTRDNDKIYVYNGTTWIDKEAPKARVYAYKASASAAANNTLVAVAFDAEVYKNTSSMHSNSTNPTRIIAPKTGCYHVTAQAGFATNASGRRVVTLRKNAAGNSAGGTQVVVVGLGANNTDNTQVQVNMDVELNANDYLEMFVLQSSGGNLNVQGGQDNTFIQMREVE